MPWLPSITRTPSGADSIGVTSECSQRGGSWLSHSPLAASAGCLKAPDVTLSTTGLSRKAVANRVTSSASVPLPLSTPSRSFAVPVEPLSHSWLGTSPVRTTGRALASAGVANRLRTLGAPLPPAAPEGEPGPVARGNFHDLVGHRLGVWLSRLGRGSSTPAVLCTQ